MNCFTKSAVVHARRTRDSKVRPPVAAGDARENEIRRPAQRSAAFLADGWTDQPEAIQAMRTKWRRTRRAAGLAGRREEEIEQPMKRGHVVAVRGVTPSLPDLRGSVATALETSIKLPSRTVPTFDSTPTARIREGCLDQ